MNFFGGEIQSQGENQPENWKQPHSYWETIRDDNAAKLDSINSTEIARTVASANS